MTDIHHIYLAGLDLNLLVVFDALMVERHVTRAGENVGLSQPATSNALARLRRLTQDDLFIRTAGGLLPTPVAIALHQQIRPALQHIQTALEDPVPFDPAQSERIFSMGMSDYMAFVLLPPLMRRLQELAPKINLQIRSGDRQKQLALLDEGSLDLLCGVFPERIRWHQQMWLFDEAYVCVCRQDHPLLKSAQGTPLTQWTLEAYLRADHLLVSVQEDRVGRVDALLKAQGLERRVALSIPHFLTAPFILAQTDLVATLARRVAVTFAQSHSLWVLPLPFELGGFGTFARWHESMAGIPAHQWLRGVVRETASSNC